MMVSDGNELAEETHEEIIEFIDDTRASRPHKYVQISIPSSQTTSLDQRSIKRNVLDFLNAYISRMSSIFRRTVDQKEEISISVHSSSSVSIRQHFHTHFIRKINLGSLINLFKEWIKHPMNIALLLWLICVATAASMLALLLLGLLNHSLPTKTSRNRWIEIDNQILNALFTLMSLYQHPNLFHHLVLLCRWRSEDILELRKVYCKSGAYRPHEWGHMMLVVIFLHITCFSQYVLCSLYWGYSSKLRPEFAETFFFALGTVSPIIAGLHAVYSPLGREFSLDTEEEELRDISVSNVDRAVCKPEWKGGLFDCGEDMTAGYLSFFCTFCVFGWNMERLGFGNMYVHMVTFFLLCVAPFWIFSISALNISNDAIRDLLGVSGLVLCVFGLMYGGFWRIKMRERFGLPGNGFCCGSDAMSDYVQWMFCWACSLAQEVRTVNFYDVEDESFHRKYVDDSDEESTTFLEVNGVKLDANGVMMQPIQPSIESECTGNDDYL